jgi:hypothetical protein
MANNHIKLFFHCAQCMEDKPANISPRDWAQIEAGWTDHGLQVWCKRHETNILHIDFEGQQHPANTNRGSGDLPRIVN